MRTGQFALRARQKLVSRRFALRATTNSLHGGNRVPRFVRVEPLPGIEADASACGGPPRPAFRPAAMSGHERRLHGTRKDTNRYDELTTTHYPLATFREASGGGVFVSARRAAFVSGGRVWPEGPKGRGDALRARSKLRGDPSCQCRRTPTDAHAGVRGRALAHISRRNAPIGKATGVRGSRRSRQMPGLSYRRRGDSRRVRVFWYNIQI